MKKLGNILVLTLAINFIAIAGAAIWLHQTGRLDREKVLAIKDILFPATQPTTQPSTQPVADAATTQPALRLEELLANRTGRSASEQVEFIQQSFDAKMAQLDRRQRELIDLQRQVDMAKHQLARDRDTLAGQQKEVTDAQEQTARLATDKGFQDSLALYNTMPAKQVKGIFMTLEDATVIKYLQSMQPRTAAKIIKEFKTPDELARIHRVMEQMRQASASAGESASSSGAAAENADKVAAKPTEDKADAKQ